MTELGTLASNSQQHGGISSVRALATLDPRINLKTQKQNGGLAKVNLKRPRYTAFSVARVNQVKISNLELDIFKNGTLNSNNDN